MAIMTGDMIYGPNLNSKFRMYKIWRKFGTPPSVQRRERAKDIDECMRIDDIVEEAIKIERRRQEAIAMAKSNV